MVAVCLSEILPDGAATRTSYGLLNLSHRDSHEFPEALEPGKSYRIRLQLNETAHRFAAGHRIRIAVSSSYWPIAWPSPQKTTLGLRAGESSLALPLRPANPADAELAPFAPAEGAAALDMTPERASDYRWTVETDMLSGQVTVHQWFDEGRTVYNEHDGWTVESTHDEYFTIHPDDPNSASVDLTWTESFERGDWGVSTRTHTRMTSTPSHFVVVAELEARAGDEVVHSQTWRREFERNHV